MQTVLTSVEIERKYDVDMEVARPELADVPGVTAVSPLERYRLEATYYDTADLRLRAARVTLRHRTGGRDGGWHLKLPSGSDREEVTVQAPAGTVPEALQALVRVWVRHAELLPVAGLTTERAVQRLLDDGGKPLVEVADDDVTAVRLADGQELRWREWEAELLTGDRALLDSVQERLLAAGASRSRSGSKVGRVLPDPSAADPESLWWAKPRGHRSQPTAAAVVHAHLSEQVGELQSRDPQARRDLPDAVHKMRVATRRLRSALATFRPLLDRERTDPLRDELRWLAGVLGQVRDAEVMHARLLRLVAAEPPELVLGKVAEHISTAMRRQHGEAHARLLRELDSDRYLRLLDALDGLVATPPFRNRAQGPAPRVLARAMHRTWRRLDRVMAEADRCPPGPTQQERLHEVRKDAKRARYAAEALVPVFEDPARRFAKVMEELQESLGDLQDSVTTREALRALGARGHLAGENGFTYGRLHALEQARAESTSEQWSLQRAGVSARKLRRWFEGKG